MLLNKEVGDMSEYVIKDGELYHYGVKGMRWGVRRTDAQLGSSGKKKPNKKRAVAVGASVAAALAVIGGVSVAVYMRNKGGGSLAPKLLSAAPKLAQLPPPKLAQLPPPSDKAASAASKGAKVASSAMKKIGDVPVFRLSDLKNMKFETSSRTPLNGLNSKPVKFI
jgi:hypothetical protein